MKELICVIFGHNWNPKWGNAVPWSERIFISSFDYFECKRCKKTISANNTNQN